MGKPANGNLYVVHMCGESEGNQLQRAVSGDDAAKTHGRQCRNVMVDYPH
jgi:hypothetical protein